MTTITLQGPGDAYEVFTSNGNMDVRSYWPLDTVFLQTFPPSGGFPDMQFLDGVGVYDPTGTAEAVARLYGVAFGSGPDVSGLHYWTGQIDTHATTIGAAANFFSTSDQFLYQYGSLTDSQFIDQIYVNALHRHASADDQTCWQGVINANGGARGQVILGISQSQEYKYDTSHYSDAYSKFEAGDTINAEVQRVSQLTWGGFTDLSGLTYWSSQLAAGVTEEAMAQAFIYATGMNTLAPQAFMDELYAHMGQPTDSYEPPWVAGLTNGTITQAHAVAVWAESGMCRDVTAAQTHANWVFIHN